MRRQRTRASVLLSVLLLAACGLHHPTPVACCDKAPDIYPVRGQLRTTGGPAGAPSDRWPGTITVDGPVHTSVPTDAQGRFRLLLPPGRYRLTGHSPRYGDGRYQCRAADPLVVRAQTPTHVDVLCQLK
jgi:hypothetical protein